MGVLVGIALGNSGSGLHLIKLGPIQDFCRDKFSKSSWDEME